MARPKKVTVVTGVRADDLRIGDQFPPHRRRPTDSTPYIKALNELCERQRSPHVHVISNAGTSCLPFTASVDGM